LYEWRVSGGKPPEEFYGMRGGEVPQNRLFISKRSGTISRGEDLGKGDQRGIKNRRRESKTDMGGRNNYEAFSK